MFFCVPTVPFVPISRDINGLAGKIADRFASPYRPPIWFCVPDIRSVDVGRCVPRFCASGVRPPLLRRRRLAHRPAPGDPPRRTK